jgi:pyruvate dehydrogenase E2 component (dihydrolipoamide acetyltransferase)
MSIAVVMPQLGLTMEEGTVSGWLKKTGDRVKKDEPLFSVSTDKVEMDVESAAEGTLGEIVVAPGETVRVGTVVAYILGESVAPSPSASPDKGSEARSAGGKQSAAQSSPARTIPEGGRTNLAERRRGASPRAKRLAKELGVELSDVHGSGPDGQITEQDVRAIRASVRDKTSQGPKGYRQLIADRLTLSLRTIPTFSVAVEVNAENFLAVYKGLNESLGSAGANKLTVTDLLLAVFARVLKSSPEINAVWGDNNILQRESVDIGLAVATDKGVVAPVIRNVDELDIPSLVAARERLVDKARTGRLALSDLEGGAGTLSNLGMYRVDHFQAIINPGQSSVLAVGQIRRRPWAEETVTVKPTMVLNFTVDHRVADGATAAVFLGKIAELIESPPDLSRNSGSLPRDKAERSIRA